MRGVSGRNVRTLKALTAIAIVAGSFFGGYALSTWRAYTKVIPALSDMQRLDDAYFSARVVSILDSGDIPKARASLLVNASNKSKPSPLDELGQYSWQWFFTEPFENAHMPLQMFDESNESVRAEVSQLVSKLCSTSPDTKATQYACNR